MLRTIFKRFRLFRGPVLALCCIASVLTAVLTGFSALTKTVTVEDGGRIRTIDTMSNDLDVILAKAGITLGADDEVHCAGNTVTIARAFSVTVDAGGVARTLTVTGGTVGDALARAGIRVGNEDELNYAPIQALEPGMVIRYADVDYVTVTEEVPAGPGTEADASEDGVLRLTYRQKLINGSVVSVELVGGTGSAVQIAALHAVRAAQAVSAASAAEAAEEPAAEQPEKSAPAAETQAAPAQDASSDSAAQYAVVQNGGGVACISTLSPQAPIELDENGVPLHYTQVLTGSATAYTHTGSNTSTGKKPQPGYIAVNPNQIPYGTRMFIRSTDGAYLYGYAVAADTGGFIKSGRTIADLFFDTYAECIQFGRRNIEIYLLP